MVMFTLGEMVQEASHEEYGMQREAKDDMLLGEYSRCRRWQKMSEVQVCIQKTCPMPHVLDKNLQKQCAVFKKQRY